MSPKADPKEQWTLYMDGLSNSIGSNASLILITPNGDVIECALYFKFLAINNEAKYESLIIRLKIAKEVKVYHLTIFSDS